MSVALCPCCNGVGVVLCQDDSIVLCELCDGARLTVSGPRPKYSARTLALHRTPVGAIAS